MPDTYHVTTPLGSKSCDSAKAVCEFINEYMKEDGAMLTSVLVDRPSDQNPYHGTGEALDPVDFWPEPQRQ